MIFCRVAASPYPAYNDCPRARASIAPPGKKKPEYSPAFLLFHLLTRLGAVVRA